MKIRNLNANQTLDRIYLYLTREEATALNDALAALLSGQGQCHSHVLSENFAQEISISIQEPEKAGATIEESVEAGQTFAKPGQTLLT